MSSGKSHPTGAGAGGSSGKENFAAMFEESMAAQEIAEGDVVTGNVVKIDNDTVVVDIGYKSEGAVPRAQFERGGQLTIAEGDQVRVYVESLRVDAQGYCRLSKERADRLRIWDEIAKAFDEGAIVEGTITKRVRGGLEVDIGVPAFLPASQADIRPPRNLDKYMGETAQFKIIKFNRRRGNVVLSRRDVLEAERTHMRTETLKVLTEGAIVTGTVKNLTDYGAFVDLGGIDGLLHVSDMSWTRIRHPSERLKPGDEIRVQVIQFDPKTERVSLGLKQLEADPWGTIETQYPVGTRLRGKVTNLVDYGAFVEIAPGVEGLIHVSEMSWTRKVRHPGKIVNVGDEVDVVVLDIDRNNRRMSLGMKQAMANPWDTVAQTYPAGTRIKGEVRSITDFGIFVSVNEDIDGLVHVSDISWTKKDIVPSEAYKVGDQVEAVVLSIDREGQRLSLGIKQLEDDPWERYRKAHPKGTQVQCRVVSVTDFGAFVELAEGVEGLIRTNELAVARVEDPRSVVEVGKELTAEISNIDTRERRISLSVRAMERSQEKADLKAFMKSQGEARSSLGDVLREKLAAQKPAESEAGESAESNEGTDNEPSS